MRLRHPVERALHLAAVLRVAAARLGIPGAAELDDARRCSSLTTRSHLMMHAWRRRTSPPGRQAEPALRRHLGEVVVVDVERRARRAACASAARRVVRDTRARRTRPPGPRGSSRARRAAGARRPSTRRHRALRSSRSACSRSATSTTLLRFETPMRSQNARIASGVYPRRRRPASVGMRGSSQPFTCLPSTSCFSLRFDVIMYVGLSFANSICSGRGSNARLIEKPVVERPVVLELERADRVRHALDRVGVAVREVVHRVDAPRVARPVVVLARACGTSPGRAGSGWATPCRSSRGGRARRRRTRRRACAGRDRGSPRRCDRGTGSRDPACRSCRGPRESPRATGCRRRPCPASMSSSASS